MEVNYKIENLDEILEHLIESYHEQSYVMQVLWSKAGYSREELQRVVNEARLIRNRERLRRSFFEEGKK